MTSIFVRIHQGVCDMKLLCPYDGHNILPTLNLYIHLNLQKEQKFFIHHVMSDF